MNWKKALGFAVLVWIIMLALSSIFVAFGMSVKSVIFNMLIIIITVLLVYLSARFLAPSNYKVAIQYGLLFAVIGIVLDYFLTKKYTAGIFDSLFYWIDYILVVLAPLMAVKKTKISEENPEI